jgi:hypothetical protein
VGLYTLYKARNVPTKSPCCAICLDRTRGRTQAVNFGYGVSVWLCTDHASIEFLTRRSGRDLVVTLTALWNAAGGMTAARHKAMSAHLDALTSRRRTRDLPGSYAWPRVRARAEQLFAAGPTTAAPSRRAPAPSAAGARSAAGSTGGRALPTRSGEGTAV